MKDKKKSTRTRTVVGIIPARYASVRMPAKPLALISGKPLVQHVYERARAASTLDRVVVATDHEAIEQAVRGFGGEVLMTPEQLASGSDRVAYAAERLPEAAIIVNIQGDEPLIHPLMIDETVAPLLEEPSVEVATPVKAISRAGEVRNPNVVKVVVDKNNYALYFSRAPIPYLRDGKPLDEWHQYHTYFKHIGLYVYRREVLMNFVKWGESALERAERLEQLRFLAHGCRIKVVQTTYDSIPVDVPEDIARVEAVIKEQAAAET